MTATRWILVVEDEFFIAEEIAATLATAGYDILGPAASVAEALVLVDRQRPDGAVLDANLRGETSLPVAARLKADRVPYILCSGYRAEDLTALYGEVRLVGKPMQPKRLLATLSAALDDAQGQS